MLSFTAKEKPDSGTVVSGSALIRLLGGAKGGGEVTSMDEVVCGDGAPLRGPRGPEEGRRRAAGAVTGGIHVAMREGSGRLCAGGQGREDLWVEARMRKLQKLEEQLRSDFAGWVGSWTQLAARANLSGRCQK